MGQNYTLTIANAKREDSGDYDFTAENSAGQISAAVQMTVREPLTGSDFSKESHGLK